MSCTCSTSLSAIAIGRLLPADTVSLMCRTVAEVTSKNVFGGYNLPILLLMKIVVLQRDLAFPHSAADTTALATYLTDTFRSAGLAAATKLLAVAFQVPVDGLDVSKRVKVRLIPLLSRMCAAWCLYVLEPGSCVVLSCSSRPPAEGFVGHALTSTPACIFGPAPSVAAMVGTARVDCRLSLHPQ